MYCPQCGARSEETARFCRWCGTSLAPPSGARAPDRAEPGAAPSVAYAPASPAAPFPSATPARGAVLPANFGPGVAVETRPVVFAGFWRRAAAAVVDAILLLVLTTVLAIGVAILAALAGQRPEAASGAINLLSFLLGVLYYPVQESSAAQATWGKRALGIMVTDTRGRRLSFWRALWRNVARLLSALLLGFGYLMAAFTPRKQALHDLLAASLVVVGKPSDPDI